MLKYSKISKYKIKKIIWHFCVDIDATKTALLLGINRNSINRYYQVFRRAIFLHQINEFRKLNGEVELDESYFSSGRVGGFKGKLNRGRGTQKQPVFGIFERNGRVYTEIIPDCTKKTLQAVILGKVSLESGIHTDGWRGYDGLVDVGYGKHLRGNHGDNEFSEGRGVHINGIESFCSFTKRRLAKFNGVKVKFEFHLKECEWRWNRKHRDLEIELVMILMKYKNLLV